MSFPFNRNSHLNRRLLACTSSNSTLSEVTVVEVSPNGSCIKVECHWSLNWPGQTKWMLLSDLHIYDVFPGIDVTDVMTELKKDPPKLHDHA
jgi:hypothetical protein